MNWSLIELHIEQYIFNFPFRWCPFVQEKGTPTKIPHLSDLMLCYLTYVAPEMKVTRGRH